MVAVNYIAVLLPLGGRETGEISDSYPNLFAPAGYAFSIWGVIYILLGIYVVYQLRRKEDGLVAGINRIFIVNALLNTSWIFAWHYDLIWLSLIIMVGLLITLIMIAEMLRGRTLDRREQWMVRVPFSVYFGWITVATIANVTVFLVYLGWDGFGLSEVFWTVAILLIGAVIGSWRMLRDRSVAYGLVLMWAYGAILVKHLDAGGFAGEYPSIIWTVALCLVVFAGTIVFMSINKKWTLPRLSNSAS
jgi:hypothetical protein